MSIRKHLLILTATGKDKASLIKNAKNCHMNLHPPVGFVCLFRAVRKERRSGLSFPQPYSKIKWISREISFRLCEGGVWLIPRQVRCWKPQPAHAAGCASWTTETVSPTKTQTARRAALRIKTKTGHRLHFLLIKISIWAGSCVC